MALNLDKTLSDIGRRELDFTGNLIAEALPEWFREDNPKLITFIEKYYEDLDAIGNFGNKLKTLPLFLSPKITVGLKIVADLLFGSFSYHSFIASSPSHLDLP